MPLKTHDNEQPSLNMTPMIDIVFLLIIFFMVGTKFTQMERKIALEVPAVTNGGALSPAPEKRVVSVYRDGRIELDERPITIAELQTHLQNAKSQYADLGVIVRGDAETPYKNVASVVDAVRQSGVSRMGISVRLARRNR